MRQPRKRGFNEQFTVYGYIGDGKKRSDLLIVNAETTNFPPWDKADAYALKAIRQGTAAPHQQQRAYEWLTMATGLNYPSYRRGGAEGERDTAHSEGKRFIGFIVDFITRCPLQSEREE